MQLQELGRLCMMSNGGRGGGYCYRRGFDIEAVQIVVMVCRSYSAVNW